MRVIDFSEEFNEALDAQAIEDEQRWGDEWLRRPLAGQEGRIYERFDDYQYKFILKGEPIPWLKIANLARIAWIRERHPELFPEPELGVREE